MKPAIIGTLAQRTRSVSPYNFTGAAYTPPVTPLTIPFTGAAYTPPPSKPTP